MVKSWIISLVVLMLLGTFSNSWGANKIPYWKIEKQMQYQGLTQHDRMETKIDELIAHIENLEKEKNEEYINATGCPKHPHVSGCWCTK